GDVRGVGFGAYPGATRPAIGPARFGIGTQLLVYVLLGGWIQRVVTKARSLGTGVERRNRSVRAQCLDVRVSRLGVGTQGLQGTDAGVTHRHPEFHLLTV